MATAEKTKVKSPSNNTDKPKRTRKPKAYKLKYDAVTVTVDSPTVKNVRRALAAAQQHDEAAISDIRMLENNSIEFEIF